MNFASQRPYHRDILGAFIIAVFSVAGALWSIRLTILKFQSAYTLQSTRLSTCGESCTQAFRDSWSEVAGLPLTVYGAAFFVTCFLLVSAILIAPHRISRSSRPLVMGLAWGGVGVSLALLLRALFAFGELCLLCAVLYIACLGIFAGAWIFIGRRTGPVRVFRRPWWRDRSTALVGLVLCSAFVALTAIQLNLFRAAVKAAGEASLLSPRQVALSELPEPSIRIRASEEARVVAALFLDLSCSVCRAELETWLRLAEEHSGDLEVDVYHFPVSGHARGNYAREAAGVLHCLAEAHSEKALEIAVELFALQDTGEPYFKRAKLEELAARYGRGSEDLDRCMTEGSPIDRMISQHIEFAKIAGITGAPGLILGRLVGPTLENGRILPGGLHETLLTKLIMQELDQSISETTR